MSNPDGDGRKEVLVARADGQVIALLHRLEPLWNRRLRSAAKALKCVPATSGQRPQTVVTWEDGAVLSLDDRGQTVTSGWIDGEPTCLHTAAGPGEVREVMVGTGRGHVTGFRLNGPAR